ncbi:MAG: site-2 protease family protein [Phycisphaerales bacterium]
MGNSEWKSSYDDPGDRFAGIKRMLARIFGDGENPLAWGFTVARIRGITFKIHLIMIVYLLIELIFTMPGHQAGPIFVIPNLVAIVVLVWMHEIAHAVVARRNNGVVEQRMLWPLGGFEEARFEEPDIRAEMRTAMAGPALHLGLMPVFILPLVMLTGSWGAILINPLTPSGSLVSLTLVGDGTTPWWLVTLWSFHVVNLALLMANLLLPMYPLDAATVLRIILTPKHGELGARHITALTGLWVATAVGLVGIIFQDANILLAIAIVSGIVCSMERRRLQFLTYAQMVPGPAYESGSEARDATTRSSSSSKGESENDDHSDIDQILAKISSSGIESLSRSERRTLKKATESSRKTQ